MTFPNVKWDDDDAFRCRPTSSRPALTAINDGHLPPGAWASSGFLPVERQLFLLPQGDIYINPVKLN